MICAFLFLVHTEKEFPFSARITYCLKHQTNDFNLPFKLLTTSKKNIIIYSTNKVYRIQGYRTENIRKHNMKVIAGLLFKNELSCNEIAQRIGISETAVKKNINHPDIFY